MQCRQCEQVPQFYNDFTNTTKTTKLSLKKWMKDIPDSTLVNQLSIPGSHDACAYVFNKADQFCQSTQCQSLPISVQLKAGIRFLDIRVWQKEQMMTHHGPYLYHPFKVVAKQISEFLIENSSECLILCFQAMEAPTEPQFNYQTVIRQLLKQYKIDLFQNTKFSTLGQMRGKAWLLGGNCIDFKTDGQNPERSSLFFHHHGDNLNLEEDPQDKIRYQNNFVIQQLESQTSFNIHNKRQDAKKMAFEIDNPSHLKFNFLSATSRDWKVSPFPFEIARHPNGPNKMMLDELQKRKKENIGVTIIDFPGDKLITAIINSNHMSQ